jgi:hypothetical protein
VKPIPGIAVGAIQLNVSAASAPEEAYEIPSFISICRIHLRNLRVDGDE